MQPRAGEASQTARTAESIAATHGSMTPAPEPNLRPPTRGEEHKVYAPKTPRPMDISTLVRDKADIDLYREHFSGYRMTRAHLSSSPYIESDPKLLHRQTSHPSHGKVQFSFPSISFYYFPSHSQTYSRANQRPPTDNQEGGYSHERRSVSFPDHQPALAPTASPTHSPRPAGMLVDAKPGSRQEKRIYGDSMDVPTTGNREGQWTERVHELKDYAASQGATLRAMSKSRGKEPAGLQSDTTSSVRDRYPGENEVKGREAAMALYSYPLVESGNKYMPEVPDGGRRELEKVRKDLKDMELQLQNATRAQINEVSATLDPASSTSYPTAPPPKS